MLKRIVSSLSGITIARSLVKELLTLLDSNKIILKTDGAEKENQNDSIPFTLSHSLIECITTLCSSTGLTMEDFHLLAIDSFLPSHHPLISKMSPDLWIKTVKHFSCKPKDLIIQWSDSFKKIVIDNYRNTEVSFSWNQLKFFNFYPEIILVDYS